MIRYLAPLLTMMIVGCSASRPMPVVVEVADATTMDPIEDVVIRADGGTFYVPTMQPTIIGAPGAMFGPLPQPEGSIGETNAKGRAHMAISGQRPVYMRFFKEGYSDGFLMVESGNDIVSGAIAWTEGRVPPRVFVEVSEKQPEKRMIFRVRVEETIQEAKKASPATY